VHEGALGGHIRRGIHIHHGRARERAVTSQPHVQLPLPIAVRPAAAGKETAGGGPAGMRTRLPRRRL
jgi:hypothetical protein